MSMIEACRPALCAVYLPKSWFGMMNDETILTSLLTLSKGYAPIVFLSLLAATILALGMSVRAY